MLTTVFVYGSLKRGFGNSHLLKNSFFVGNYKTDPDYTLLDLGFFPAVINKGSTSITGEVYLVDNKTLRNLDALEGYPSFYDRKVISIYPVDSSEADPDIQPDEAWIYFMEPGSLKDESHLDVVKSGIWK